MRFLLDTNVVSELRKGRRCHPRVAAWYRPLDPQAIFLRVMTIGEIRRGIESLRPRDATAARALNAWLERLLADHQERIVAVDQEVAQEWGRLNAVITLPVVDGLLAATTRVHGPTLATRNVADAGRTGAATVNPFAG